MSEKRPLNILWLMSDQHNAGCLGVEGHPDVRTPNLDVLAESGVRFERAYCNNPICGPSRSCFLTGQRVKRHGVSGNFIRELNREAPNLARLFRENGYETALIGKAHLPRQWVEEGFEYIRLSDLADASPEDPRSCHYFNELVESGWADQYDSGRLFPGHPGFGMKSFVSELPESLSLESWTGREALRFLDQRDESKPFFLKVSFQRPHDPYAPPASCEDWYDADDLILPESSIDYFERGFSGKPEFMQEYLSEGKGSGYPYRAENKADLKRQMARHFTLITMIDAEIGKILDTLRTTGDLENTLVVYVADHGDFAGEHGLVLKNFGIYESIHRIPFIVSGPGVPGGKVSSEMIESIDFFPTLARAAGIECPDMIDGDSRWPMIQGSGDRGVDSIVCEWDFPVEPQVSVHAVRTRKYRLVVYDSLPGEGELYDCEEDPDELENLYGKPELSAIQHDLEGEIRRFRGDALRVHTSLDDRPFLKATELMPTRKIHAGGWKWSQIKDEPEAVRE